MPDNKVNNKFMLSVILAGYEIIKKRKVKRRCWSKQWLLRRSSHGFNNCLLKELRAECYKRFLRIEPETFDYLNGLICQKI